MARISGVDLPPSKRVEIGLTYMYGIGRARAMQILEKAQVVPSIKVRDLTDEQTRNIQRVINAGGTDRGRPAQGDLAGHQAADRDRLVPRDAAPPQSAGARAAHAHERADAAWPTAHGGGQEEDVGQEVVDRDERGNGKVEHGEGGGEAGQEGRQEEGAAEHPARDRQHPRDVQQYDRLDHRSRGARV